MIGLEYIGEKKIKLTYVLLDEKQRYFYIIYPLAFLQYKLLDKFHILQLKIIVPQYYCPRSSQLTYVILEFLKKIGKGSKSS